MSITVITPPAAEPVALADMKARLRVEHADEDDAISALIAAARDRVERLAGRALITRTVAETRDSWEEGNRLAAHGTQFRLGLGPLTTLHQISTFDEDDAETVFDAANYYVDALADPPRVALKSGVSWPAPDRTAAGVRIEYDAGYGAAPSDVPESLREAVTLLVIDAYEARTPAEQVAATHPPLQIQALIAPFARMRL